MRHLLCSLLLPGLAILSTPSLQAGPQPATTTLEADVLEFDLERSWTRARGNASFVYGTLTLRADEFTADRQTGDVEASGNLTLAQGSRHLRGDLLRYNTRTEQGVLTNARVAEQGVFIAGEEIVFSPSELIAREASFTTCDRAQPHYTLGARRISLTAEGTAPAGQPQSGRLTLERARVTYGRRRLLVIPRYSVLVGELEEPGATPIPVTGFSRDDGPYASISYAMGEAGDPTLADLSYRYTTLRGIRGHLRATHALGPLELIAQYVRREDPSDREFEPDDLEAALSNVLVNRAPEYGLQLPEFEVGGLLLVHGEWLRGNYSERLPWAEDARARADRAATSLVVSVQPYAARRGLQVSHAVGWRRADYSSGESLETRFQRHSADLELTPRVRLSLSHITRGSSGRTPFLFDERGPGRELLGELRWRIDPRWRVRLLDLYDLEERRVRDMMFEVTRTMHCIAYTVGWRKSRGRLYLGIGLVPAAADGSTE